MRIESVRIRDFGRLHDLELNGLDHPLVVITGSNEAGKSTFFEFLKTMLFGIYPTSTSRHRYVPWSGGVLDGELSLRLNDGTTQTVSRRLRSAPEGQLLNGSTEILRNQTVPAASHVSRELFDAFYALRLDDLAAVHGRSWEEVQQRLLSEMSPDSIRPVPKVLRELEESANALWRPDRRGKPLARKLHEKLRAKREEALQARKRDAEARRFQERADELERRLAELQQRRLEVRTQLKQLEAKRPLGQLVHRRELLLELVGDRRVLTDLPADARSRLEDLRERSTELADELASLDEQLEAVRRMAAPLEADDELLLEHAVEIREMKRRLEERIGADIDREVDDARRSFVQQLEGALGSCPPDADTRWAGIEGALAEALHGMESAAHEQTRLDRLASPAALLAAPAAVVALSATVWALISVAVGGPAWTGWLLAAGAATLTVVRALRLRRQQRNVRAMRQEASDRVELLAAEAGLSAPAARLAESFAALSSARRSLAAAERAHASHLKRQAEEEARTLSWLADLARRAGWTEKVGGSARQQIGALEQRLARIELAHARTDLARPQLEQLENGRRRLLNAQQECDDRRRRLEARLAGLDPDPKTALELLEERHRALGQLSEIDVLLGEDATGGGKDAPAAGQPEMIAGLEEELETINQQSRELSAEAATLRTRVEHLAEQPSLADLEGEILMLRRQIEEVRARRDRLALLRSIVLRAQQRFRERHQPDVLRRASDFLSTFTARRYRRVDFNRESERLEVYNGAADPLPVAEPLSQGTRDQIYLALRLAVVDHLDRQQEALPLFLDEILVNWDRPRRTLGYQVLREMVRHRQLFVFTCHEWLAEELEHDAGAHRIELT